MAFWKKWLGGSSAPSAAPRPRAAMQQADGGVLITNSNELDDYLRGGAVTASGASVTPETAMRQAVVFACVRLISSAVATMPLDIKRRVDDRVREEASDSPLWPIINRRPNRWQLPHQFRRLMQARVLLRGNAFALVVRSGRKIIDLVPLDPERMEVKQADDLSVDYVYTLRNGGKTTFKQSEILHLYGLTLNGTTGVSPITYARETIGMSLAMENHGASTFRNGARVSGMLVHPHVLSEDAVKRLKESLDEYRAGGTDEGRTLILEEGMTYTQAGMTSVDAQWIESRKFSRADLAMFFGVPPHMIGDTEKSTSWGTGIEQQAEGFKAYTLDDHLVMWEQAVSALSDDPKIYARFNRAALVRGDIKARWAAYVQAAQWGILSPNEIRSYEDMNPRDGGDAFYEPPNTAGTPAADQTQGQTP